VQGRGPRVEVILRDNSPRFFCYLTGFKNGCFSFQMLAGESRTERTEAVQGIRFITQKPALNDAPAEPLGAPPPGAGPRNGPWPGGEAGRRLRELVEKDLTGNTVLSEIDEIYKLRNELPPFPPDTSPLRRLDVARRTAMNELTRGRLDRYIRANQERIKRVATEEEARDCLFILMMAYLQKGMAPLKIKEAAQRDVESIENDGVRRKVVDRLPEIPEPGMFRPRRPGN